ncbi:MAG TPA: hypothetical protein PLJ97_01065, partial [Candidatus Saccharibacteria bacterium]|nr:hypothetical protein [Candidatus Saccharibacteria bacterium]
PIRLAVIAVLVLFVVAQLLLGHLAKAAALDQVMVRFDRMRVSTQTTGTICAKPSSTATENSVRVTFPTGYSLGSAANFTTSTSPTADWPSGASPWVNIQAQATSVVGQVVTWTSGDLTAGTLYCFNWNNQAAVQTAGSASTSLSGLVETLASGPTVIDSAAYTTNTITDDQILVSATVPQAFSFALSGNSDALGTLSSSSVSASPTPRTVTINTNAKLGWQVWARDANTGLNSASAAHTIASTTPGTNSVLSAGTEGYNTGLTSSQAGGTGTIAIPAAFVGGSLGRGGGLDTTLRTIATSNGTAQNAVLTINNNVAISSLTSAAADYSDTITIVGAGLF